MLVCSRTRVTLKYILLSERNQTPKVAYDVTSLLSPSGPGQVVTMENTSDVSVCVRTGEGRRCKRT